MPCTDLGNEPENIARFAAKIVELVSKNRSRAAVSIFLCISYLIIPLISPNVYHISTTCLTNTDVNRNYGLLQEITIELLPNVYHASTKYLGTITFLQNVHFT